MWNFQSLKEYPKLGKVTIFFASILAGFQVSKGKLFEFLPRIEHQWYMSFGIKPKSKLGNSAKRTNIFQLTLPGNSPILSGWFLPRTRAFYFCQKLITSPPTNKERCHNLGTLPISKFTDVQIRQGLITALNRYELVVIFNNRLSKLNLTNLHPRVYKNVKIWISDPWNNPAQVTLRSFVFKNLPFGK